MLGIGKARAALGARLGVNLGQRHRIARAIEAVPRRLRDRNRARLEAAAPAVVAIYRKHSPVRTGRLRRSWMARVVPHGRGGFKLAIRAVHYWFHVDRRGRSRGFARRAAAEARRTVLRDTTFSRLPPPR